MSNVNGTDTLFQRIPTPIATALAAVVAGCLSIITGTAAAWSAVSLYDHVRSKGDDIALGVCALFAVGTFVFITCFSWMVSLHHQIRWSAPVAAVAVSIGLVALATWIAWDPNYSGFILAGWLAVLVCAGLALLVASWLIESPKL